MIYHQEPAFTNFQLKIFPKSHNFTVHCVISYGYTCFEAIYFSDCYLKGKKVVKCLSACPRNGKAFMGLQKVTQSNLQVFREPMNLPIKLFKSILNGIPSCFMETHARSTWHGEP